MLVRYFYPNALPIMFNNGLVELVLFGLERAFNCCFDHCKADLIGRVGYQGLINDLLVSLLLELDL